MKVWLVLWKPKQLGSGICSVEPIEKTKVKCRCKSHRGWHYIDSLAVFRDRKDAVAFMKDAGSNSFRVKESSIDF